MTRDQIVAEARKWLGVPFRHQGRDRNGIDCVGMLVAIGTAFNIPHEDIANYPRQPSSPTLRSHIRKFLTPAKFDDTRKGNVAVVRDSIFPCHVGILSEKNGLTHIIHARADQGRVIEELFLDDGAHFRLIEILALPGVED